MKTMTKKRKVINYLTNKKGRTLTAAQAKARFDVANLRATISDIRYTVEEFGNWEVVTQTTSTGKTAYSMMDTHPGRRTYRFDKNGRRKKI